MADHFTRRNFLATSGSVALGGLSSLEPAFGQAQLSPTPACNDGDQPTARQTEGPFFKPRSPERSDLREPELKGKLIELSGHVLTRACRPVDHALVDLWHADGEGDYDNRGFRGRGHVFTDAEGRFRFLTVVPANYPGRTKHFHMKVQTANRPVLTTQLYFPDEAENRRDGFFNRALLMRMAQAGHGVAGRFDFVLDMR